MQRRWFKRTLIGFGGIALGTVGANLVLAQIPVNQATITAILEGDQVFIEQKQSKVKDVARKNQQVRTGKARAELTFNNKAVARLGLNSQFIVGQCGVQLEQGTALISGTSGCTRQVTAAVRGTTYVLTVDPQGKEEYHILDGAVDFGKTSTDDPHQWSMSEGDSCTLESGKKGVKRRKLSRREYTRLLRGKLFRGYETAVDKYNRLQSTHARLFPGAKFPLRQGRLSPHRGHYFLTIRQENTRLKEVIARVSWQRRRRDVYLPERFVGDFVFPMNQKAEFVRGLQPEDRISVRLFDRQNNFLGYTEFEGLDENSSVSIVLPNDPALFGTLRTVFGDDVDRNNQIDRDALVYDFFTQVKQSSDGTQEALEVLFPREIDTLRRSAFAVDQLPPPLEEQGFPDTFYETLFSPVTRPVKPFDPKLETFLTAPPGTKAPFVSVRRDGTSSFEVPKEILRYRSRPRLF